MAQSTFGTELMKQINDGKVGDLPSELLAQTRDEISSAIDVEPGAGYGSQRRQGQGSVARLPQAKVHEPA